MAARLKLESVSSRPARPQTRRSARQTVRSRVSIRSGSGQRAAAQIDDVSSFGCLLVCDVDWLRGGMFIGIALAEDRIIQAVVRWVRDGKAGTEFLRPISEAELRQFAND